MEGVDAFAAANLVPRPWALESQGSGLLMAHREVFGSRSDERWLEWKYGAGQGVGLGLWSGNELAAFCGGLPRRLWWGGRLREGLQIVDVMVRQPWRHGARRQSAFFRVSQSFYESQLGVGRRFEVGYGFPSHRHLQLADRLGVLHDGGPFWAAVWDERAWPAARQAMRDARGWVARPLEPRRDGEVLALAWKLMRGALRQEVVAERDVQTLRWRHLSPAADRPLVWIGLQRAGRALPSAVAVLQPRGHAGAADQALWLDYVGPPQLLRRAWAAVMEESARHGATQLHGWFTNAPWALLEGTQEAARTQAARIGVPTAGAIDALELSHRAWWMMAGDTDFL